jgi:magnesium transporter
MTEVPLQIANHALASWSRLTTDERLRIFQSLPASVREDLLIDLPSDDQAELVLTMPERERRTYMRVLPPDDVADLIQASPADKREGLLRLLDEVSRTEVRALLAYAEDDAGGLMSPRFARLRPNMTVDEAISYLRLQAREMETVYYAYTLDTQQRLMGVVSFRDLFTCDGQALIIDVMRREVVCVREEADQEEVARIFSLHDLAAIPVVDAENRVKGIVTIDDIVHVVEEEATEDIQKIGGMEALHKPYLETRFLDMIRKRAGWLAALFLGEMLTATAMSNYEEEITRAVVLAVFIPLIISSGGNSGSQASTLVVRAMALGELRLRDWRMVAYREIRSGLVLGAVLAVIGFSRILLWQAVSAAYGIHYMLVATTIALSLIGVVLFGTIAGSMLPFLLRWAGADPASASAPFVATLVDVTGIVIYFSVAAVVLRGTIL